MRLWTFGLPPSRLVPSDESKFYPKLETIWRRDLIVIRQCHSDGSQRVAAWRAFVIRTSMEPACLIDEATKRLADPRFALTTQNHEGITIRHWQQGPKVMADVLALCRAHGDREFLVYQDELTADGWFRTGDIARVDEEGFVTIVDRAKDIVIRGGENIPCLEIGDVRSDHPAVVEAAVIGRPNRTLGEDLAAFVVLASGGTASEKSLLQYAATRLPLHKVPSRILISLQPLPKNPAGKVIKANLKRLVSTL